MEDEQTKCKTDLPGDPVTVFGGGKDGPGETLFCFHIFSGEGDADLGADDAFLSLTHISPLLRSKEFSETDHQPPQ